MNTFDDKVECADHGLQDATYVCCHLVESLNTGQQVGFFYASEPRGDAWCASCEEVRIREGGESAIGTMRLRPLPMLH